MSQSSTQQSVVGAATSAHQSQADVSNQSSMDELAHSTQATESAGASLGATLDAASEQEPEATPDWPTITANAQSAVQHAVSIWSTRAFFTDVNIMAISAIGSSGCLDGPSLVSLIASAPTATAAEGAESRFIAIVAEVLGGRFDAWQRAVTIPGLPLYPTFAAWPGPMAPPMPNVPMPLVTFVSTEMPGLMGVGAALQRTLGTDPAVQLFCTLMGTKAVTFLSSTMVTLLLGKGPVPSWAPPYVPVGPVVNGSVLPIPGAFLTARW